MKTKIKMMEFRRDLKEEADYSHSNDWKNFDEIENKLIKKDLLHEAKSFKTNDMLVLICGGEVTIYYEEGKIPKCLVKK